MFQREYLSLPVGATGWSPVTDSTRVIPPDAAWDEVAFLSHRLPLCGATIVPFKRAAAGICLRSSYSSIFRRVPTDRQTFFDTALLGASGGRNALEYVGALLRCGARGIKFAPSPN